MAQIVDDRYDIDISVIQPDELTLMWSKTAAEIGLVGMSPPILHDVDGDGVKELFWAGKQVEDAAEAKICCLDGATGLHKPVFNAGQNLTFTHYWGAGNVMRHLPMMCYDFNHDGNYEIIASGGYCCYNAVTGSIVWTASSAIPRYDSNGCWRFLGWHNNAFIDHTQDDYATIYSTGGGFVRKINGDTGAQMVRYPLMDQVPADWCGWSPSPCYDNVPGCWGGISIADLTNSGQFDIVLGTKGYSHYQGLMMFDEDLTTLRWNQKFTCSSQCPKLCDIDNCGYDEIIIANQSQSPSHIRINKWNPNTQQWGWTELTPGFSQHVAGSLADVDGDGHMEFVTNNSSPVVIIDVVDNVQNATIPSVIYAPVAIGKVLTEPGVQIIVSEGDATRPRGIYRHVGNNIYARYPFALPTTNYYDSIIGDIDGDGLNEIIYSGEPGIEVWKTSVQTPSPEPITQIWAGGMRRLNNNIYYPLPIAP